MFSVPIIPSISDAQDSPELVLLTCSFLQENDFKKVASLYSLPEYFSQTQKAEERKIIEESLRLLSQEFGTISELKINQDNVRWINLEIFGGDVNFIKSNQNYTQFVFNANFSILGRGFIVIRVYENNGDPKLRSVGFALNDSPKNRNRLKPIADKLIEIIIPQKQQKRT